MSRRTRVRFWLVWATRDARRRWVQVVAIALLLALGTGMYSSLGSMGIWRKDSLDASFSQLKAHDLRVTLADGSYARQGALARTLALIPSRTAVTAANERLVVPTQVEVRGQAKDILVPGRLVGAPVSAGVDRLALSKGRPLGRADAGRAVAELERNFARHYALPAQGSVLLAGGTSLRYIGQVEAPEYFVVTTPGADFGGEANFAVLFASLPTVQKVAAQPGRVNQLVLRVRPGVDFERVQSELGVAFARTLPKTGVTFTRLADEPAHCMLYKDAEDDQQLVDVFAILLLAAATFAAFNLISRTVEAQRREIGIGMALGLPPRALTRRPILLGVQTAVLGVAVGIPAGLAANQWLRSVLETWFPLPVLHTPLEMSVFVRGALLGLLLPLAATALPVWRAVRVQPVEAIQVGARAAKSSGAARLVKRIRLPGGSVANMPVSNVLRTPRRTLMTLLGIAAVVSIVIALSGVFDSFSGTLDASRSAANVGAPGRLTVDLVQPQPAGGQVLSRIADDPSVGDVEQSLRLPSTLRARGDHLDVFLEIVEPRGRLWRPTIESGTMVSGPGVVIAREAAKDLHVRIGDAIVVRHPVPTGPNRFELVDTRLRVSGVHGDPFRFLAYAGPESARTLGVAGLANRLSVVPARGVAADQVKRALMGVAGVSAVQEASATIDAVSDALEEFRAIIVVTVAIAVAMALLIAFNASVINADERAREQATMFAFGLPIGRVMRMAVIEALLVGVLSTLAGLVGGWALLHWEVGSVMPNTVPDVGWSVVLEPVTFLIAFCAGTVAVALAPLLTLRRLRRTDVPSTLRVVE